MKRVAARREARVALGDEDGERLCHDDYVLAEIRDLLLGEHVTYRSVGIVVNLKFRVIGEAERTRYALHSDGDDLVAVAHLHQVPVIEHEGRGVELAHVRDERGEGLAGKLLLGLHPLPAIPEELAEDELHVELGVVEPDARVLDGFEPREEGGDVVTVGEDIRVIHAGRSPRPHAAVLWVRCGLEVT